MPIESAKAEQQQFYLFVCSHSFLIGLFPFFLPVYLYQQGLSMAHISFFIATSALAFSIGLYFWDVVKIKLRPTQLLAFCYALELLMVMCMVYGGPKIGDDGFFTYLIAVTYGIYQCFFWTTQRALFMQRSTDKNTGNHYGNFQIFVVISLKSGVFISGLLLDNQNIYILFILSLLTIICGFIAVLALPGKLDWPFLKWPVVSFNAVITFKDKYRSKQIFALDGFFLFIESFFLATVTVLDFKTKFYTLRDDDYRYHYHTDYNFFSIEEQN